MKGLGSLILIAVVYLFFVIFLQDAIAEPRGVNVNEAEESDLLEVHGCLDCHPQDNKMLKDASKVIPKPDPFVTLNGAIIGQGTGADAKKTDEFGSENAAEILMKNDELKSQTIRAQPRQQNVTNPLVDIFAVSDPATQNMLDAAYGSYSGDDQCRRKSFCMMGNYVKEMPGRDLFFMLLGGYIPPEYSLFYDIFRNSALYGQNCNVYVCVPPPTPDQPSQTPVTPVPPKSQPR